MSDAATIKFPFQEDPVVAVPTPDQIAAVVAQHGSAAPAVLKDIEDRRRKLIALRKHDLFNHGYVSPL